MSKDGLLSSNVRCAHSQISGSTKTSSDILVRYNKTFETLRADTTDMVRNAQAIRYQVYCLERSFENAAEHKSGLECDDLDDIAIHNLLVYRPTSEPIGTARLILASKAQGALPIQKLLHQNCLNAEDFFPVESTAEVSRFAISNHFRRRCATEEPGAAGEGRASETCSILPCLGLIQELLRQSIARQLTHWAAVMEPKLRRMLEAMGIVFTPIGPTVSYHGLRQMSYCCLTTMLNGLRLKRPDYWMVVTDGGTLLPADVHQGTEPLAA